MPRIFMNSTHPKFIFITNYKVMSSSIMRIMTDYFPHARRISPSAQIFHMNDYITLAICRNPFDRIFSVYHDKCLIDPGKKFKKEREFFLQDPQEKILYHYYKIKDLNKQIAPPGMITDSIHPLYPVLKENLFDLTQIDIHDFILIVDSMFSGVDMDHHFIPQTTFLTENNVIMVDHCFKLENIGNDWSEICRILEMDLPLLNRNNTEQNLLNTRYSKEHLNAAECQVILERYKMDFNLLNY
jgi:hypothetical protein